MTRLWCALCALLVAAQMLAVVALPFELVQPWGTVFQMLCVAALTLLAWIATDGLRPTLAVAGAMGLCFFAAHGQAQFLAGTFAAVATGSLLFRKRGPACVESSQP